MLCTKFRWKSRWNSKPETCCLVQWVASQQSHTRITILTHFSHFASLEIGRQSLRGYRILGMCLFNWFLPIGHVIESFECVRNGNSGRFYSSFSHGEGWHCDYRRVFSSPLPLCVRPWQSAFSGMVFLFSLSFSFKRIAASCGACVHLHSRLWTFIFKTLLFYFTWHAMMCPYSIYYIAFIYGY